MQNPGEEIVGECLKHFKGCDFVEYNLHTPDVQGEIDVVGINQKENIVYICEVATHLTTGLQYTKGAQVDNVDRLTKKFIKNINYAEKYFKDYRKRFMFWSPIVKNQRAGAKNNQTKDIEQIKINLLQQRHIKLYDVVNETYLDYLSKLRVYAANEDKELKSPILRLMQIEEKLATHVSRLKSKNRK